MVQSKPFLDKKKSVRFKLVHRSQRDPLIADEESSRLVLQPCDELSKNKAIKPHKTGTNLNEQFSQGIFFEDDYDYLQHLKESNQDEGVFIAAPHVLEDKKALNLPSDVFQSEKEEKIGLLHLAAPSSGPKLDWDPDIVGALDEDAEFCSDFELEDDFILIANQENPELDSKQGSSSNLYQDEDAYNSELEDEEDEDFEYEETRSRFTNYSMTSSVMHRNEGLRNLDDHFEKILQEYDSDGIGGLDIDEIGLPASGNVENLDQMFDELLTFSAELKYGRYKPTKKYEINHDLENPQVERKIHQTLVENLSSFDNEDENQNGDMDLLKISSNPNEEKWDCETILSTYSNIYNHPTVIREKSSKIRISRRTGLPLGVLGRNNNHLSENGEDCCDGSNQNFEDSEQIIHKDEDPTPPKGIARPKHESNEEKRCRKAKIKMERKERRVQKKALKDAFKLEEIRQEELSQPQSLVKSLKL